MHVNVSLAGSRSGMLSLGLVGFRRRRAVKLLAPELQLRASSSSSAATAY
jgi:hypothetical protein